MNETVKRLQESRNRAWEQAKELADRAADENRAFSGDEEGQWQSLNAEMEALDGRVKSILAGEQRAKDTEDALAKIEGRPKDPDHVQQGDQLEQEVRAFLRGDPGAPRAIEIKPTRTAPTSQRDLSKVAAAGGFTVPTSFYNQLQEHMIEVSGVLQAGPTVLNTASGEVIQIPKTLTHTPSPAIVLEGGAILESDGTFGQVSLGAWKYGRLIDVTRELVTDTGVDLLGYLAKSVGRALGNAFGSHMILGTGVTMPRGIQLDAAPGVTGPVGTTVTFGPQSTVGMGFDLLISLYHSVISPYRASSSCAWVMNDTTASIVRRIKTTDGNYVWQPAVTVGAPDTILGKPVYIDPFVLSPGISVESVYFGDWSTYFVRYAGGIRFERSEEFRFDTDMVSFRGLLRADAALVDLTGSIKSFVHSAA